MFGRKKLSENINPLNRANGPKKVVADGPAKGVQAKTRRPATGQTKRAAFGDITNATKDKVITGGKKKLAGPLKPNSQASTSNALTRKTLKTGVKKKCEVKEEDDTLSSQESNASSYVSSLSSVQDFVSSSQESTNSNSEQAQESSAHGVPLDRVEEDFSFITVEPTDLESDEKAEADKSLLAVDQENYTDVIHMGIYAQDIFEYYKRREKLFPIPDYMRGGKRCHISPCMRAILVDWMVEIQENFELNHETLYLGVKLSDMYISRVEVQKEDLQLVGAASLFIASKFDERCPPLIEDFTYICDNAFDRDQFIEMEMEVLRKIGFDLGIPISYRFLRRYAKVSRMSLETLTLARFILELSLMEYQLVMERDSMLAAAALYIAQRMRDEGTWEGDVVKASGYSLEDIKPPVVLLNRMLLAKPVPQLASIRTKYSHVVFHEVAKIPPLPMERLL